MYDIIITFAERYDYTVQRAATPTGNGTVWDDGRRGACELQVTGVLAGQVACFQFSSSGVVVNQYLFKYGLDETFSGSWVSPTTFNVYSMKGFRVKSKDGFAKSLIADMDKSALVKAAQDTAVGGSVTSDAATISALSEAANAMSRSGACQ